MDKKEQSDLEKQKEDELWRFEKKERNEFKAENNRELRARSFHLNKQKHLKRKR